MTFRRYTTQLKECTFESERSTRMNVNTTTQRFKNKAENREGMLRGALMVLDNRRTAKCDDAEALGRLVLDPLFINVVSQNFFDKICMC